MAGASGGTSLEHTPTWAVAIVCFVLLFISITIEHIIHLTGKWLTKRHKRALYESVEKLKSELMLLGFISLLLTVGEAPISSICVSKSIGDTWLPCNNKSGHVVSRRVLAGATYDKCAAKGKVPFVSSQGIHQLHIFIFVLVVFHVLYCLLTLAFGTLKMRRWKSWEMETKTVEYEFSHDPERFRFAKQTSFGKRHFRFWTRNPVLMWIVCFFRQFVRSVPKIDYLTLRHGFIMAHLTPQSQTTFDFQKYINRSLEEDFKVVVGISPPVWFSAVLFLLFNTHGWFSYLWLPFIPLIMILVVGTKLQVIITQMGLRYQQSGEVVKGLPVVELGDHLFWFGRPRLLLYLINFVLFQNAFQLAFLVWSWFESGFNSCFVNSEDRIIRFSTGILTLILCSYVTLPLYALVTQMGTTMKLTIFNEKVAKALRNWHRDAKRHVKQSHKGSSRPSTPPHRLMLGQQHSLDVESWVTDSASPSHHHHPCEIEEGCHHGHGGCDTDVDEPSFAQELSGCLQLVAAQQLQIDIPGPNDFSFDTTSTYQTPI